MADEHSGVEQYTPYIDLKARFLRFISQQCTRKKLLDLERKKRSDSIQREHYGEDFYNVYPTVDEAAVNSFGHAYARDVDQLFITEHQPYRVKENIMTTRENADHIDRWGGKDNQSQRHNTENWMTMSEAADYDDRWEFDNVGRQEYTSEDWMTMSEAANCSSDSDTEDGRNGKTNVTNQAVVTLPEATDYDDSDWGVHDGIDTIKADAIRPCGCETTIMDESHYLVPTIQGSAHSDDSWNICERCGAYFRPQIFEDGDAGSDDDGMVIVDDGEESDGASVFSIPEDEDETEENSRDVVGQTMADPIVPADWWGESDVIPW